ncbi:hypothetical protein BYT27DRAFT_7135760 [Phlegmacium glaucopus]|nr:hypothetical protein BYT27DRAFT_7135760 [Phlegmacium glaucopus]
MSTKISAVQPEMPLRRRIRILERASSLSSLADAKIIPEMKHHDSVEDIAPSSFTDYESRSDTSGSDNEGEKAGEKDERPKGLEKPEQSRHLRPTVDTTNVHRRHTHDDSDPMSPYSRAWYEFDLAVVVALVSPVGNWLTGGDHIKNLLLIVLLIFYLHQIIEIPWMLYQQSRRRRSPRHTPQPDPESAEARYAQLAASELRRFEFFFLFLTFLSPFLGASLLRYATSAVLGPDAVSWFSTGLFVLATGMRPWAHLVERLSKRTMELQDYVHHPSPFHVASEEQHLLLEKRVAQMEKSLSKIKSKVANTTEDVYEYVDDAVDAVEHAMRKQERKWDKYEEKVKEVEQIVVTLKNTRNMKEKGRRASDLDAVQTSIRSMIGYIMPTWLTAPPNYNLFSVIFSPSALFSTKAAVSEPKRYSTRTLSGNSSPSTPLETILEEEPISNSNSNYPLLTRPYSLTSDIVYRTGYIITLPLRAVVRMILRNY